MRKSLLAAFFTIAGVFCQKADEYKIQSLPGIDITTLKFSQYAGHIELSKKSNSNIFFWMVEQEEKTAPQKLIIWLNGGPGCSSMDGLFLENGPFRVKKDLSLSINKGGWQKYATNVYVDQPVGTGYSFADLDSYMHNMTQITEEFVQFMDKLYDIFPKLRQQDLYIAGESFAGSYIPYFANRILKLNRERDQPFRLKGIAIGNGWISAKHQYSAYYDFSIQHGLVSDDRMDLIESHFKECQQDIANKETIHISSCEKVLTDVTDSNVRENKDMKKVCLNVYDIRMKDEPYPECGLSWPYELADVTRYLRLDEVKRAIHAEKQSLGWKECTSLVSIELNGDESRSSYYLLPDILEEIPVLLYNGEYDLVCNTLGIEYLIGNMTWNGSKGFKKGTKKEEWKVNDKLAGYVTRDRNLTYVMIKDGSHMVPYDKPTECLDMINRFIQVEHGQADNKGKEKPSDKEEEEEEEEDKPSDKDTKQEDEKQTIEQEPTNERSKYYSWGIGVFVVVLFVALALCCWCFGSRRPSPTAKFGGAPQREREGVRKLGVIGHLKNLFSRKTNNRKIFRLGDQDETNELDELVVETPTLFEAEENFEESQPGPEGSKPSEHHHFTIDDEHDDEEESDFDFADWDEESTLRKNKK
ncbi:hypothetical protein G6F68_002775 [Rhizopus microsporus]|nr:hypothetical protein G6F67_003679 [Rhizopus microsporus]KAG1266431.1 hypothetical protein G6F68_002775 [Rhizopus microsporus]